MLGSIAPRGFALVGMSVMVVSATRRDNELVADDRFDARLRRIDTKRAGGLATFDTAPELPFGGDDDVPIKRISMRLDFHPLAAAGDHSEHRAHGGQHPHIVLQLRRISSMPDAGGPTGGFFIR
jgi:hypothetical protein